MCYEIVYIKKYPKISRPKSEMRGGKRLHDIDPVHTAEYKRFTLVPHYNGVHWCPGSVHISCIPKLDKRLNGLKVEVIILREYEEMTEEGTYFCRLSQKSHYLMMSP